MIDWITWVQKVYGRLVSRELFAFRPEVYDEGGLRADPLRERQRRLGRRWGTRLFSRRYAGVPGRVHVHDTMLQNDSREEIEHYIRVGQSAMTNIEAALAAAGRGWGDIESALDMACGYGRVLRWLVRRVAPARVSACEVLEESIRFCHAEFGAGPLLSNPELARMRLPREYDLIWVGSLFTHLVPETGLEFLAVLGRALRPRGVLLFSTQGPSCLGQMASYGWMFKDKSDEFRRQLEARGAAYLPYYQNHPDYGIALHTPGYVDRALGAGGDGRLGRIYYAERGWDAHQDVHGFQRSA
jgi:SAM-dependent methyltransferase